MFGLREDEELALEANVDATKARDTFEQGAEEDFNLK